MSRDFVLFLCLALCFLTLLFAMMRYQPDPTYLIMGSGLGVVLALGLYVFLSISRSSSLTCSLLIQPKIIHQLPPLLVSQFKQRF